MKPFLALSTIQSNQINFVENNNRSCYEIYYNGFTLLVDQTIFPVDNPAMVNVFYLAMYRITLFLNTLPLYQNTLKVLKVTGFTDFCNFKIEPASPLYVKRKTRYLVLLQNNKPHNFLLIRLGRKIWSFVIIIELLIR